MISRSDIMRVCEVFKGVVVVDEAYADFAPPDQSCLSLINIFPNLMVLRTFSKAWGLAGIRLGMAIGNPDIISYLMNIKAPYNINRMTASVAREALKKRSEVQRRIALIQAEREKMARALSKFPKIQSVFPSVANFILFRVPHAKTIHDQVLKKGIVTRYRGSEPLCSNCLRVTIGSPEDNSQFLKTLSSII